MLLGTLYFLFVITIVVFIHEFGHFIVAKMCGVKVLEFSIGFGKRLCGWKDSSGVDWNIRLLPLGGFVKMYGDDNASGSIGYKKKPSKNDLKYSLMYKHPLKKIAVASAGPLMNFVLAVVLYICLFAWKGIPQAEPVIGTIMKNSQAEKIGLLPDDKIVEMNGVKISSFNDIRPVLIDAKEKVLLFELIRNNKVFSLVGEYKQGEPLGITAKDIKYFKSSFGEVIEKSFGEVWRICSGTIGGLWNIIAHQQGLKSIGGPIAIAKESAKAGSAGLFALISFIALISTTLGIINICPIPLLDGGHIVLSSIELIIRRHLPNIVFQIFTYVGIVVIVLLMGLGFFNDIFIHR